jgi:uncharacterized peroxidase-related enzyme
MSDRAMFLGDAPPGAAVEAALDKDRRADGFVNNFTRLWCWRPDLHVAFTELRARVADGSSLTDRDRAVIVTATVAERNDSYCSLAWGARLAALSDDATAAKVIAAEPAPALSAREAALADWSRRLVQDPNSTTQSDVERLREVGLTDKEIFEATALVAFRLAFSTINDALGAAPDKQLADEAPVPVRAAVTYGRAPASAPSPG